VEALGVIQLRTTLRGTLSGTIKSTTGAPLAGITVTASVNGSQIMTTSAADGSYAFTDLDVGAGRLYSLRFADPAGSYLPLDYDADPSTPNTIEPIKVIAGQAVTANAVLQRTSTLSGTVKNTAGAALAGVTVKARLNGSTQGELTTTSKADGSFAFTGLVVTTDRLYSLSFSDPAGSYLPLDYDADPATPATREMVKVVAGETATANAVLRRTCTLSGVVTDSRTSQAVAGLQVRLAAAPGQTSGAPADAAVHTDAAGAYTFTGVPEGTYVLACNGQAPLYKLQYWPAAQTAETATQIVLSPASPSVTADVTLQHDDTRPTTAALNAVKMRKTKTATLKFRVADAYGDKATLTLIVATSAGKVKAKVKLGVRTINIADSAKWKPARNVAAGKYTWWVTATDQAGNAQSTIVKKSLVLTK
jgi:hypothetical protein